MSDAELKALEDVACPGPGACGGQFTANTMATVGEFLGISAMGSASVPATREEKDQVAIDRRRNGHGFIEEVISAQASIITREALENAIASVAATGGSTNAVLHLFAIANEAGVELEIEDFDRISTRTPLLADLKPSGQVCRDGCIRSRRLAAGCKSVGRGWNSSRRCDHGDGQNDR